MQSTPPMMIACDSIRGISVAGCSITGLVSFDVMSFFRSYGIYGLSTPVSVITVCFVFSPTWIRQSMLEPHCTFIGGYQSHGIAQLGSEPLPPAFPCLQWDSNPQSEEVDFKSTAYTDFAMEAYRPRKDDAKILCHVSAQQAIWCRNPARYRQAGHVRWP